MIIEICAILIACAICQATCMLQCIVERLDVLSDKLLFIGRKLADLHAEKQRAIPGPF